MKVLSLKLPDALNSKLTGVANRRGVTKSALVREAIEELLAESEGVTRGSVGAQSADLCGGGEGPSDLSFNPAHMEGFGQ